MSGQVVVISTDDADTMDDCLDGIAEQRPAGVEVVVVDQNSSDDSADVAIRHPLPDQVVVTPPGGLQRIVTAAANDTDRLLVIRADSRPQPGWLLAGLTGLERAAVVVGPDRQPGNMAIDLGRLGSVNLFVGTEGMDDALRRVRAAGGCWWVADDMCVVPAARIPHRRPSLPSREPPRRDGPRYAGVVTVVVCTHGRPVQLARCLASLDRLDDDDHEIVVVDNNAVPSVDRATLPARARLVHEPRRGLDIARNRGIAEAAGEVVAYIDDDCEADPQWITALRVAFGDPEVGTVTGRVRAATLAAPAQRHFEAYFSFDRGVQRRRFTPWDRQPWYPMWTGSLGTGCNMAIRRRHLVDVGGFDEVLDMGTSIGGGGDLDLYARLLDRGVITEYAPDALVWHHHRDSRRALARQFRGYGESIGAYLTKTVLDRPGMRYAAMRYFLNRIAVRVRVARQIREGAHVLPMHLLLVDLFGQLTGPVLYLAARWAARRR